MSMRLYSLLGVFFDIFFLSNLLQYPSRDGLYYGKPFLIFGIFAQYVTGYPESSARHRLEMFLTSILIIVPVGGFFVLIINVIVQAVVRRWRGFKTLISFYLPLSLIPSPLLMSLRENSDLMLTVYYIFS